jgi:hypothetical protein
MLLIATSRGSFSTLSTQSGSSRFACRKFVRDPERHSRRRFSVFTKDVFAACGGSMRGRDRGAPISPVLTPKNLVAPNAPVRRSRYSSVDCPPRANVNARTEVAARHLGDFVEVRQNFLKDWLGLRRLHRSTVRCPIANRMTRLSRSRPRRPRAWSWRS